jgi:hypothetical protein
MRARAEALIERAKARLPRDEMGRLNEDRLDEAVAALLPPIDAERVQIRRARALIELLKRPGSTEPDGQLVLPLAYTIEPYPYEPARLVSNGLGQIIEANRAPTETKAAQALRARLNADRAGRQASRLTAEAELFQKWALEQAIAGRSPLELTWGNCVHEMGLWSPEPAPPDPDADEADPGEEL